MCHSILPLPQKNAIIDPWKSWFEVFPDATCEVQNLIGLGYHIIVREIGQGTYRGAFNSPAGILELGSVKMHTEFCDVSA